MEQHLYHYRAQVTDVYDGDTCTMDIDLGMGIWLRGEKIRLARINAPEMRGEQGPQGLLARDFLRSQIIGREVWISSLKDKRGKYGRTLPTSGCRMPVENTSISTMLWCQPDMPNMPVTNLTLRSFYARQ